MSDAIDLGPTSQERLAQIVVYQESVKRLTAENRALAEKLKSERQARRDDARRFSVQINEGLTPELLVLRRQLSGWRARAQAAEAKLAATRRSAR